MNSSKNLQYFFFEVKLSLELMLFIGFYQMTHHCTGVSMSCDRGLQMTTHTPTQYNYIYIYFTLPCIMFLTSTLPLALYTIRITGKPSGLISSTCLATGKPKQSCTISNNLSKKKYSNTWLYKLDCYFR